MYKIVYSQRLCITCILGVMLMIVSNVSAAVSNVTVKVTVIAKPVCVVNGNKAIQVDFGNAVQTDRVNGSNYTKEISYDVSCEKSTTNAVKMKIDGLTTDFDTQALKLNKPNLGIALYNGNTRISFNTWFNFTWPNKPVLKAVPVRRPNAPLQAGAFDGSATMTVEYQ